MITRGHDLPPPKFLQIKQDDKFFSRLLSKESSKGEASFRVLYYGGNSGSIPFTWESRPGTPKHTFADNSLPPLTPPPSYQLSSPRMKTMQKHSKPSFLSSIFPRISWKKSASKSASFSSSSLSHSSSSHYSSYSLPSTPMNAYASRRNNGMQRSRSAIHFGLDEDDDHDHMSTSPTSTLCFGAGTKCVGKSGSGHPMKNVMKKAFLSIAGHGAAA